MFEMLFGVPWKKLKELIQKICFYNSSGFVKSNSQQNQLKGENTGVSSEPKYIWFDLTFQTESDRFSWAILHQQQWVRSKRLVQS